MVIDIRSSNLPYNPMLAVGVANQLLYGLENPKRL